MPRILFTKIISNWLIKQFGNNATPVVPKHCIDESEGEGFLFIKKFGWDICVVQFNGFRILFERHWNIGLQLKHVVHKRWGDQKLFCKRNCKCFSPDHLIHSSNSSTTFPGQYFWWKYSQIKKQIIIFSCFTVNTPESTNKQLFSNVFKLVLIHAKGMGYFSNVKTIRHTF